MWSMRSVQIRRGLVLAACVAVVACSDDDTEVTRRGGPTPSSDGGTDPGGSASGDTVTWCDAFVVIKAKCQRCHQDPPQNAAPMPLLSYEDTQGAWSSTQDV